MAVTDLDLAVLLLNSVDLLEEPPDRMADDLGWWRRALARNGLDELAAAQRDDDLPCSRRCAARSGRSSRARTTTRPGRCSTPRCSRPVPWSRWDPKASA